MDKLSQEFLDSCRRDGGLIMRGENMTRIETFVDAAFAFAFTMLVISIDEIPRSPPELVAAARDIPAFIFSATIRTGDTTNANRNVRVSVSKYTINHFYHGIATNGTKLG